MRIVSWNINGLRAVMDKGFVRWLNASGADVVGLQETRAHPEQVGNELERFRRHGWHVTITPAVRKGYSGTGLLSRRPPDELWTTTGVPDFDAEGRLQFARFGKLLVVNGYFPNGAGKDRDHSRMPFKLEFTQKVFSLVDAERVSGGRVLVMGDFNTAHTDKDIARPKENAKTSGFTPIEREEMDRWVQAGWIDTFRHFVDDGGHYSWWSQRFGVREKNIGWRIDYVMASHGVLPYLRGAFIQAAVKGSDHAPVGIDVDDAVVGGPGA
jgi:exodeoxyribonuclease III